MENLLEGIEKEVSNRVGKKVTFSDYSFYSPDDFVVRRRIFVEGSEFGSIPTNSISTDNVVSLIKGSTSEA
jgi:hypothetical protein